MPINESEKSQFVKKGKISDRVLENLLLDDTDDSDGDDQDSDDDVEMFNRSWDRWSFRSLTIKDRTEKTRSYPVF